MKWIKSYRLFESRSLLRAMIPSDMTLLKLFESKLMTPTVQEFYSKYPMPPLDFDKAIPKIYELKGTAEINFMVSSVPNYTIYSTENVYSTARFLSDFIKKELGSTPVLPQENELEEEKGKDVPHESTANNLLFKIVIVGPSVVEGNSVHVDTELYLQYMSFSLDYGKKYSKHFHTLTKEGILEYITHVIDLYVEWMNELYTNFMKKYSPEHILETHKKVLQNEMKFGNSYEIVGNLQNYPEVIQLLGLSQQDASNAGIMKDKGFTD